MPGRCGFGGRQVWVWWPMSYALGGASWAARRRPGLVLSKLQRVCGPPGPCNIWVACAGMAALTAVNAMGGMSCVHAHKYNHMHAHTQACTHTDAHTHTHTCMHARTHVRLHTHTGTYAHTCINTRSCTQTHTACRLGILQSWMPALRVLGGCALFSPAALRCACLSLRQAEAGSSAYLDPWRLHLS